MTDKVDAALPQFLAWFAAQGINLPPQAGAVSSPWVASMETTITNFISQVVIARLVPVMAAFFVLKATLDAAQGHSPLGAIVAATFGSSLRSLCWHGTAASTSTTWPAD